MGLCIIIIFYYINPNNMHMLQSLFYLTIYIINNNCNFNLMYRYSLSLNLTLYITV